MEQPERSCTTCQTDVPTSALTCPFCGAYVPEAFELDGADDAELGGVLPTPVGEPVVQLPPPTPEEAAVESRDGASRAVVQAALEPPRVLATVPEPARVLEAVPEYPRSRASEPETDPGLGASASPAATVVEDAEGDVFDPAALVLVETDIVVEDAPDLVVVDDRRAADAAAWAPPPPPPTPAFGPSDLGLPHLEGPFDDLPYAEDDPELESAGGRWWGRRRG